MSAQGHSKSDRKSTSGLPPNHAEPCPLETPENDSSNILEQYARPHFDGASFLRNLVWRYNEENCEVAPRHGS